MTQAQKVIKYCALAFAIFLIVAIIGGIVGCVSFAYNVFGDGSVSDSELSNHRITDFENLTIEMGAADVEIISGEKFSLKSNHDKLKVKESDGRLILSDDNSSWNFGAEKYRVVLTIPKNTTLESTTINSGAGKLVVKDFNTKKLDLSVGAGVAELNKVKVTQKTEFEGGAGEINVTDSFFASPQLEIGVGECNFTAEISGNGSVDCGVGEANLSLITADDNDYTVNVSKGIGDVTVNGKSVSDDEKVGNGKNKLDVDCGVGEVDIRFVKK